MRDDIIQSAQLQSLAKILNICVQQVLLLVMNAANNKCADQTVVLIWHKQISLDLAQIRFCSVLPSLKCPAKG